MPHLESLTVWTSAPSSNRARYFLPKMKSLSCSTLNGDLLHEDDYLPALNYLCFFGSQSISIGTLRFIRNNISHLQTLEVPFSWDLCRVLREVDTLDNLVTFDLRFFRKVDVDTSEISPVELEKRLAGFRRLPNLQFFSIVGNGFAQRGAELLWEFVCRGTPNFTLGLFNTRARLPPLHSPKLEGITVGTDVNDLDGTSHIDLTLGDLPKLSSVSIRWRRTTISIAVPCSQARFTTLSSLFSPLVSQYQHLRSLSVCETAFGSLSEFARSDVWVVVEYTLDSGLKEALAGLEKCKQGCTGNHQYSPSTLMKGACRVRNSRGHQRQQHFATNIPNLDTLLQQVSLENATDCLYAPHRVVFVGCVWFKNCSSCLMKI